MMRRWLPVLLILFGGWGLLEALSWQAGLGKYAESPQILRLNQGLTAIAAGGRAGVVFLDSRYRRRADILVRCEEKRRQIKLRRDQTSEEICGVRVKLLDILPEGKIDVEISWGNEAPQNVAPDAPQAPSSPVTQPDTGIEREAGVREPESEARQATDGGADP